jgi:hypothetical protein
MLLRALRVQLKGRVSARRGGDYNEVPEAIQKKSRRPDVMDLDSYYHNRVLRWAGHVARMPMTRASRQLLTGWVAHSRPNRCPEMTWGRTLKKALKCEGLPVNFKEWRAIAGDRSEWRSRTYSKPVPPSEN